MAKIFNIQKYCLDDGPGIRTAVFLKGCPLNCKWCHNPEGQSGKIEILFYSQRCINCRTCEKVCKKNAHHFGKDHIFNREYCNYCMECVTNCPSGALSGAGEEIDTESLVKIILEDKIFYEFSGGGVTFSGGEPTSYLNELKSVLSKCRENNIHTAIETCGYFDFKEFLGILDNLNLVIFDLKLFNPEGHMEYTGVSNEVILNNLAELSKIFKHIWIRIPVIPPINTGNDEIKKICRFINSLKEYEKIELIRFDELGVAKYEQLGKEYDFVTEKDNNDKIFFKVLKQYRDYLGEKVQNTILNPDKEKQALFK